MMSKYSNILHDFRGDVDGKQRWAQVLTHPEGYAIQFFINNVFQTTRVITGHSEQYAEDAAENFVLGVLNLND